MIGGLLVGVVVAIPFASLMRNLLPLPVWKTNLQTAPFLKAAAIGFVLPVLATLYPVWRAVQVEPVDALSTAHVAAGGRGGGLAPLLRRFRWRGRCLPQLPFRNLLRAPRRTLLTTLSIGAAIAVLVAVVGLGDSFIRVVDRGAAALTTGGPDRVTVQLDNFYTTNGPEIARISAASGVASADPGITLAGTLSRSGRKDVDVVVELLDFTHARWAPKPVRGGAPAAGEIMLSPKAASDLGVGPGDTVQLRHPRRTGPTSFVMVDSACARQRDDDEPDATVHVHEHRRRVTLRTRGDEQHTAARTETRSQRAGDTTFDLRASGRRGRTAGRGNAATPEGRDPTVRRDPADRGNHRACCSRC